MMYYYYYYLHLMYALVDYSHNRIDEFFVDSTCTEMPPLAVLDLEARIIFIGHHKCSFVFLHLSLIEPRPRRKWNCDTGHQDSRYCNIVLRFFKLQTCSYVDFLFGQYSILTVLPLTTFHLKIYDVLLLLLFTSYVCTCGLLTQ